MQKPAHPKFPERIFHSSPWAHLMLLSGMLIVLSEPIRSTAQTGAEPSPGKAPTFEELFGDPLIVRGEGFEIKQSELNKAFTAYRSNLAAQGKELPEAERGLKEAQLLDRMIVTHLLTNQATRMDRTVATGLAEKFYSDTKSSAGSDEAFERQLRLTGLTPEQFNNRVFEQALAESVLEREVKSKLAVSEEEIEMFYREGIDEMVRAFQADLDKFAQEGGTNVSADDISRIRTRIKDIKVANLARLEQPEKVRVAHILLATILPDKEGSISPEENTQKRIQIEALLKRAQAGEDFLAMVKEFSEDRRVEQTGGIYTFARDEPYAPEFKAAAFSLKPGQISDVVITAFGYHVIKLLEIIPPTTSSLESVKDDIKEFLLQQKLQLAMPIFFAKLKSDAKIEILDKRYRITEPGNTINSPR